jgi:hypothetical protein
MEEWKSNGMWPKLLAYMFIAGGVLCLIVPGLVHWSILPGGLDSRWLFYTFFSGLGLSFAASLGLLVYARHQKVPKLTALLLGMLTMLLGSFWAYLWTLFI